MVYRPFWQKNCPYAYVLILRKLSRQRKENRINNDLWRKRTYLRKIFNYASKGWRQPGMAARNRQQVFKTDLTTFDLLSRLMRTVKDTISLGDYVFWLNTSCSPDVFFPRGGSAYERGGDARRKFWIKPLKETSLGMTQAFFDPQKRTCFNMLNIYTAS